MLKWIIKVVDRSRVYIVLLVVFGLLLSAASIFSANALGLLTYNAVKLDEKRIFSTIGFVGLGYFFELIFVYIYRYIREKFKSYTEQQLQIKCAKSINETTITWIENQKSGDLIGRLQTETESTAELLSDIFPEILLQSTRIATFGLCMFYLSWKLTLMYLALVFLVVIVQLQLSKPIQKHALVAKEYYGQANALAQDILIQRKTIKVFNAQPLALKWYGERLETVFNATLRTELFSSPIRTLGWICGILPILLLCIVGMVFVSNNAITLSSFMSIYFLAEITLTDLLHYADIFTRYRHSSASLIRIYEIIEAPEEIKEWNKYKSNIETQNGEKSLLSFKNVWFNYHDFINEELSWVLSNISFELHRGEKIAFVGKSGCGKSTILKLISGLLIPQKGVISLEGEPYTNLDLEQIRDNIALVSQDSFLFPDTIKNNILMGTKNDINECHFEEVCKQSQVSSFIGEISDGINTQVGEHGSKLSGGQLQRISIARALLKEAPILIFDEATSALDAITEEQLQYEIDNLPKHCAAIIVAHRLPTIRNVNRIYVMEHGCIVEQGTHHELIDKNGLYARLYHLQESKGEMGE